jgi:hypothetical protein
MRVVVPGLKIAFTLNVTDGHVDTGGAAGDRTGGRGQAE